MNRVHAVLEALAPRCSTRQPGARRKFALVSTLSFLLSGLLLTGANAQVPGFTGPDFPSGAAAPADVASDQIDPALGAGDGATLIAWTDLRSTLADDQSVEDIYAARVAPDGSLLDVISLCLGADLGYQRKPRVSWNGENWLVTWSQQYATEFFYADAVFGIRVASDGTLLDAAPFQILMHEQSSTSLHEVTAIGTQWVVVASGTSVSENGLSAVRVAADGTVLDATPMLLVPPTTSTLLGFRAMEIDGDLVVTYPSGSGFYEGRRFSTGGTLLSGPFSLPTANFISNGSTLLGVWFVSADFVASTCDKDGNLGTPGGIPVPTATASFSPTPVWDGTRWWIAWQSPITGIEAIRLDLDGNPIDAQSTSFDPTFENFISTPTYGARPGGGVGVVWADRRVGGVEPNDVRYGSYAPDLSTSGDIVVSRAAPAQLYPNLCESPNGFMAVWAEHESGLRRVMMQRLAGDGSALDPPQVIAADPNLGTPSVAFDGTRHLVVWSDSQGIAGQRFDPGGAAIDATPLRIMDGFSAEVAALDGSFLVVGLDFTSSIHYLVPFATRVDGATGAVLDANPMLVAPFFTRSVRVERFGNRWLVTWQRHWSHDETSAEIGAVFVDGDGRLHNLASAASYGRVGFGIGPDVAVSGSTALIVWRTGRLASTDTDLVGQLFSPEGTSLASFTLNAAPGKQTRPVVTWDGQQYVVVWEDHREAETSFDERSDLYLARVTNDGTVLDPDGLPLVSQEEPVGQPAIARSGSNLLVAASFLRREAPNGNYRLGVLHGPAVATTPPIAAFTVDPAQGCGPLAVAMQDLSVGASLSWQWSFGDGTTSTDPSPVHTYTDPGLYTVALTVSDGGASESYVLHDGVEVLPLVSAFGGTGTQQGCAPLTVDFTNSSTGQVLSHSWDFGDGNTSSEAAPTHVYASPGTYTVSLTVVGECNESTRILAYPIEVASWCPETAVALSEQNIYGDVVFGDYTGTHAPDYAFEQIQEELSGGRPADRTSRLEHRWTFNVIPGDPITLHIHVYRGSSQDGDQFQFETSTDGQTWNPAYLMADIGVRQVEIPLPSTLSGTFHVRVVDTDRTPGNQFLDTIQIDLLRVDSGIPITTAVPIDPGEKLTSRIVSVAPNPLSPSAVVSFRVEREGAVRIDLYDLAGRRVVSVLEQVMGAGEHRITLKGRDARGRRLSSGVYFLRLNVGGASDIRRVVILR